MPCTALPKISIPILTLTPHNSDPTQKMPTAVNSTDLRPNMSDSFPHDGAAAAFASKYALPIHV